MKNKKDAQKSAVALGYQPQSDAAPMVKAKGNGYIASEIIKKAKENNIAVQEDPSLVELLSQLEMNKTIPPDLYEVAAEVFAFLYRIDQNTHEKE
ncbi:EscU/YscU/HrcU family type III secretion system export apparatus switch protein [Alteribacillus bidgolensis]|uniref:Flagellar biosynthesis protein n=1 Tax=Alteribacillus bidgolensis TaxID=930129 RepID=A0A1G8GEP1_9BACI|nr:EscU/YscU/HrcU family type III secretion system export apparatus switch protein [Alteribacillus bidgolensis]SDH92843.1 flagellar biosynthesis protein [Alteribacillus bidgolensis]